MVTAYYISKLSKKSDNLAIDEYYQYLLKNFVCLKTADDIQNRCRVCLKPSSVSIYDKYNASDVLEVLRSWSGITIEENDDYPQSLCTKCFMFVKTAILFKKKAQQTEAALNQYQYFKVEANCEGSGQSQNFNDDSKPDDGDDDPTDHLDADEDTWLTEEPPINVPVKPEKNEEKVKLSPKVTCRICGKTVNRSYYREHLTMHDPNPHQWVCEVCGKSFRLRCAYHNHSLRHRNDFPHKCPICPYRGRYKELLKTHMRTHSGDYRYMCTECPARFLFKSNLNTHMLKHKEPQFKCDSCKRAFHSKLFLQRHYEADHLGIRNHVCNICGKAFGYRNAMMKHQRHVHKREKSMFGRMPSYLAENKQQQHSDNQPNM
ncbi:zinc finger protein 184-like [Cydia amplana]|uniref:zinc finger protein 184-like n=1 Tax=Cydia amplana TaxID=1869771 RepID=UPI002FE664F6